MLRQSPGFAATAVLAVALGVGVNTAIFTIFDQIAFRPLPLKDGDRIVGVYETFHGRFDRNMHGNIHMLSYPEFLNFKAHNRTFTDIAAYAEVRRLTLAGAQPEAVSGMLVTDDYFRVMAATAAVGRTFLSDEIASAHAVAVLSNQYWQRRFGSDREVIGKTIRLNQTLFTIVGVLGAGFVGTTTTPPEIWLPLSMQPQVMADLGPGEPHDFLSMSNLGWLSVIGKLRSDVSARQAQAELGFLAAQTDTNYPGRVTEVTVLPSTFLSNPEARPAVLIGGSLVLAAVALVLFVACANVANLLLARATRRQREIAVRLAIGATRLRLMRQLLTESTLLAVLGGAGGLLLAQRLLAAGRAYFGAQNVDLRPDVRVLSYTLMLSVAASLMFGLIPALQTTSPHLSGALKEEGSIAGQRIHKSTLRSRLISFQVAICCVLLIGAGLLVRGLMNLNRLDPGFHVKNVFLTSVDLRLEKYDDARSAVFYREFLAVIDAEFGAHSALAAAAPLRGVRIVGVALEGQPAIDNLIDTNSNLVSGRYFDVLGIRLLQGRTFSDAETARGDPVAVISEAMAKVYWKDQSPLGKQFLYGTKGHLQRAEVIGVARDVRSVHIWASDGPLFYLPARPNPALTVVTRSVPGRLLTRRIQQIAHQLDPNVLVSVRTIEDNLEHETSGAKAAAGLALALAGLALALACVGIYGVTAYVVSQRTHEIGVRMALGAERSNVLGWIVGEAMRPVCIGMGVGLPLAAGGSMASSRFLLGVHPLDPIAFLAVALLLGIVAATATYWAARRAACVDPMIALRYE
jgi:putative ABC transport system permease protein